MTQEGALQGRETTSYPTQMMPVLTTSMGQIPTGAVVAGISWPQPTTLYLDNFPCSQHCLVDSSCMTKVDIP